MIETHPGAPYGAPGCHHRVELPRDIDWERFVSVRLRPSRLLSASQQLAVAIDFRMESGSVDIRVRVAMLASFLRRMRLDYDSKLIEVENQEKINAALRDVRTRFSNSSDWPKQ